MAGRSMDPDHLRRLADAGLPVADAEAFSTAGRCIGRVVGDGHRRRLRPPGRAGPRPPGLPTRGGLAVGASDTRWRLIEAAGRTRDLHIERGSCSASSSGPGGSALADRLDRLVRSPTGPTVLWSSSHTFTPELLGALAAAQVSLPLDCSFLSFGDSPWAAVYRPPISVITGDLGSVGTAMTEALLHRLGAVDTQPRWDIEPDRYVPRASVGPAPPRPG